jgi:hypothetical protein
MPVAVIWNWREEEDVGRYNSERLGSNDAHEKSVTYSKSEDAASYRAIEGAVSIWVDDGSVSASSAKRGVSRNSPVNSPSKAFSCPKPVVEAGIIPEGWLLKFVPSSKVSKFCKFESGYNGIERPSEGGACRGIEGPRKGPMS